MKRRTAPGEREGKERKNRKTVQIFLKVNGLKKFLMDVSMTDKVSEDSANGPCLPCRCLLLVVCHLLLQKSISSLLPAPACLRLHAPVQSPHIHVLVLSILRDVLFFPRDSFSSGCSSSSTPLFSLLKPEAGAVGPTHAHLTLLATSSVLEFFASVDGTLYLVVHWQRLLGPLPALLVVRLSRPTFPPRFAPSSPSRTSKPLQLLLHKNETSGACSFLLEITTISPSPQILCSNVL